MPIQNVKHIVSLTIVRNAKSSIFVIRTINRKLNLLIDSFYLNLKKKSKTQFKQLSLMFTLKNDYKPFKDIKLKN